ncbi:MAG: GNAT family N-acetyltransferase [Candidatus Lokiarchaeota archaeon]|nr:GNAT family N-acetyltransferase [Candidatus Lokiarchaeota archaeon]
MKENFEIRKLTELDREAYRKLMRYAFETVKNNYEDLKWPSEKVPIDWYYGAFDEEQLVAGAGIIPFEIRMRSQDFKMHGVGGVASKPEYRNRGIIREIMVKMFKDMHENNISLSVLYPFKLSFYEMLGYKLVDEHFAYEFKISDIIFKKTDYHMKEVERINDDIRSVYDKAISNFDYIAKRPEIQYYRGLYKNNYKFICYNGNQPVGYVIIIFTKKGEERWLKHPEKTIVIQEAFWLDQTAKQTIFNFLWGHRDQRKYIAGVFSEEENIIDLLKTPRIKSRYIFDNSLLRIIDVKTVLENLKYPLDNFSIIFHITDEFCPWNKGFFTLTSEEKKISVEFHNSSEKKADVEIDVSYLAQILAGFRTISDLLDFGFVSVNQEKIGLLQDLFPLTNNYFHDFF